MYYQVIIRSQGGFNSVEHDLFAFKTEDEAIEFCNENKWEWYDENEFCWDLDIREKSGEIVYMWELESEDEEEPTEEVEYITTYAPDTDMTFILKETSFVLSNGDERYPKSTEVVGFYYGQPDEKLTKEYTNHLKAKYSYDYNEYDD